MFTEDLPHSQTEKGDMYAQLPHASLIVITFFSSPLTFFSSPSFCFIFQLIENNDPRLFVVVVVVKIVTVFTLIGSHIILLSLPF